MPNQISEWKKLEGRMKESVWLSQGIDFYRDQLLNNPDDKKSKMELGKLLVRSGTDEKIKYVNLQKAQALFEEVLELFPDDADALYRLGHISYENGEYESSISYFIKALEQPLSEIRAFRSACTIAKASSKIYDDDKALIYLEKAKEIDLERNFTSELNEVKSLITHAGHYKRVVKYSDGFHQLLPLEDSERLQNEAAEEKEAVLDISHFHPTFIGPQDDTQLERKEAEILSYLIERKLRFVSKKEFLNVWEEDEAPELDTIKTYISKIKRKVIKCFPEEVRPIIESKRGYGYRWICKIPTHIIKVL